MPARLTTSKSKGLFGSVEIRVHIEDDGLRRAFFDAFFRDASDIRMRYSLKLENSELVMYVERLNVGDLRAFLNSNLRLLKVVSEGLKVIQ